MKGSLNRGCLNAILRQYILCSTLLYNNRVSYCVFKGLVSLFYKCGKLYFQDYTTE
jgi:hypothetical protein